MRCALRAEEHRAIENFRYSIYIRELGKSLRADHEGQRLTDADDVGAMHFYCRDVFGFMAGTARVHVGAAIPPQVQVQLRLRELFGGHLSGLTYLSRFMVRRSIRGTGAALCLLSDIYDLGRQRWNGRILVAHCALGLVRHYVRIGMRPFGPPFELEGANTQQGIVLLVEDRRLFEERRSFLSRCAKRYANDPSFVERMKYVLGHPDVD